MKIPTGNATGLDDISLRLLTALAPVIAGPRPLASMMNISIRSGVVPAKWKQRRVTPIFKEGDRFETSNYRPISVIPAIKGNISAHHQLLTPPCMCAIIFVK